MLLSRDGLWTYKVPKPGHKVIQHIMNANRQDISANIMLSDRIISLHIHHHRDVRVATHSHIPNPLGNVIMRLKQSMMPFEAPAQPPHTESQRPAASKLRQCQNKDYDAVP